MSKIKQEKIKSVLENFNEPIVFQNYINEWKILNWSLLDWETYLGNKELKFRKYDSVKSTIPIWEESCTIVNMTMKDFVSFQNKDNSSWLYFDYKYMEEWFTDYSDILNDVSWNNFGYPELTGKHSTIWIGSKGAHTPCHMDTYGSNLIAQIYGRKKWIIIPSCEDMKPTRVPYEESSVYSKLNFYNPDINNFKHLKIVRSVTLNPGDVLFLPFGWWHYVENIETAISVNIWLPQFQDDRKRIEEAFTQLLVSQLTKMLDKNEQSMILNPNNTDVVEMSLSNSLDLLDKVIEIYNQKISTVKLNKELIDILKIINEEENLKIVPILSNDDFFSLLKNQQKYLDYSNTEKDDRKPSNVTTIEKLINAVCHPDILHLIVEKLINK